MLVSLLGLSAGPLRETRQQPSKMTIEAHDAVNENGNGTFHNAAAANHFVTRRISDLTGYEQQQRTSAMKTSPVQRLAAFPAQTFKCRASSMPSRRCDAFLQTPSSGNTEFVNDPSVEVRQVPDGNRPPVVTRPDAPRWYCPLKGKTPLRQPRGRTKHGRPRNRETAF